MDLVIVQNSFNKVYITMFNKSHYATVGLVLPLSCGLAMVGSRVICYQQTIQSSLITADSASVGLLVAFYPTTSIMSAMYEVVIALAALAVTGKS